MKRYRILYSNQFWVDFRNVLDCIMEVSSSTRSAEKWYNKIMERINSLQVMPNLNPVCWFDERYRSANVGKYKIVYQVVESVKEVRISRLLLGRRNLVGIFAS